MLKFILQIACDNVQQHRHGLFENPKCPAIWTKSPLATLQYHDKFNDHTYSTNMRRFLLVQMDSVAGRRQSSRVPSS
eukprot:7814607-Pyramimonas_sp.AAC.1